MRGWRGEGGGGGLDGCLEMLPPNIETMFIWSIMFLMFFSCIVNYLFRVFLCCLMCGWLHGRGLYLLKAKSMLVGCFFRGFPCASVALIPRLAEEARMRRHRFVIVTVVGAIVNRGPVHCSPVFRACPALPCRALFFWDSLLRTRR